MIQLLAHLEHSPLALVEWDPEFRIRRWSRRAEKIFGWKAEEVLGRRYVDFRFIHDEDLFDVCQALQALVNGETRMESIRHRNYTKEGRVIDCAWHNSAIVDADGKLLSIASLILDETQSRHTSAQLTLQNERLEFTLAASDLGVWDLDLRSGRILWMGSMEKLMGFEAGEFDGTFEMAVENLANEDRDALTTALKEAIDSRTHFDVSFRVMAGSSKQTRWIQSKGKAFYDEHGDAVRISGTAADITSVRESAEELILARQMAETANALKSAFLANMSHEIRTPLGVILGFSELLSDGDLKPEERQEFTGTIARNGRHLSRLIDDILDLSKVEAGRLEIHPSEFELVSTLTEVFDGVRALAQAKSVALALDLKGDVPYMIKTDVVRFKQIVTNLTGNALKFTSDGEVRVSVAAERFNFGECLIRITVEDSGIGISEDGRLNLFEPFVQADRARTRKFGGTGLGLALSRKLARALGGDVLLKDSTPGRGSVFEFTLAAEVVSDRAPLASYPTTDVTGVSMKDLPAKPLSGIKVLLAEDTPDNQVLMDRLLKKRGVDLTIASDGEQVIDQALGGNFDLVLMDIQMPKIDGYEATRRLRQSGFIRPIVALTAHAMKGESRRCLEAGCDAHLTKPVKRDELVQAILKLVKGYSPIVMKADGVGISRGLVSEVEINPIRQGP